MTSSNQCMKTGNLSTCIYGLVQKLCHGLEGEGGLRICDNTQFSYSLHISSFLTLCFIFRPLTTAQSTVLEIPTKTGEAAVQLFEVIETDKVMQAKIVSLIFMLFV